MTKKKIFTIGFELPEGDFQNIPFDSDQSLLDADIILYEVGFGNHYASETYQGESLFSRSISVRVSQNLQHWRSELIAATNATKLLIVFLAKPLTYFRYTGAQNFSGTGSRRVTTRSKRGSGLEMTHFFNNKQVLMENVSFQDPKALLKALLDCYMGWWETPTP